jgi:hypothetical protein
MKMKTTYFSYIIELLQKTTFRNKSEDIQTALGKYYLPKTLDETTKNIRKRWL